MNVKLIPYLSNDQVESTGIPIADVYQSAKYNLLDAKIIIGEIFLIHVTDIDLILFIPVIKRNIETALPTQETYFDLTSAYGYPGYLSNRTIEKAEMAEIIVTIRDTLKNGNIVSLFLRLNPIINNQAWPNSTNVEHVFHGKTIFIDLSLFADEIKNEYSTNHKRDIKKLKQTGNIIHINNWEHFSAFIEAYNETMALASASKYYFFDIDYFNNIKSIPGTNTHLITVINPDNIVTAGAIFFETNGIVQYHLGGTKSAFRNLASSKLIFDSAIDYFKSRSNNILHLGGGFGATEDALFRFKSGFSNYTLNFSTLRLIINNKVYHDLVKANPKCNENPNNFFPLYRKQ